MRDSDQPTTQPGMTSSRLSQRPLRRAYAALLAYAGHLDGCDLVVRRDPSQPFRRCTCGLEEDLRALETALGYGRWRRQAAG